MVRALRKTDQSQKPLRLGASARAVHAPNATGHGDILLGSEFGQQMMELVDEAQRLTPYFGAAPLEDLPAPDCPTSATISPRPSVSDTSRKTTSSRPACL